MKKIVYGNEAKEAILRGVEKLANAVNITLGPKGKNVALKSEYSSPVIINDGVSIAKEVVLEDEIENMGAELLKEVALKTNDIAGDGTTTATVLAHCMVKEGMKNITAGANPVLIRNGMNKTLKEAVNCIKEISHKVESNEQIEEIANISSENNEIGKMIYNAIDMIGKEGVITVDESKTSDTTLNIVEGLKIDSGYISSYMVEDSVNMEETLNEPYILITNKKIVNVQEILPLLEKISQSNRPLVMIVDDIEGEALATLIVNKMRGTFNSIAVKAPSFGDGRKEILEDIALVTGGKFIDEEIQLDLKDIKLEDLGCAKSVKISKESTIILRGCGKEEKISNKIEEVKTNILSLSDESEIKKLRRRLARLLGGVAVIEVGAATQTELNEKKLRIEDALSATRAAIEEGIVDGGGRAYITVGKRIKEFVCNLKDEEQIGGNIVLKALEKPLYYIAENAGQNGDIIVEKIKESDENIGYNANKNMLVNMKEEGIIDPTKVTRIALENAVSISSMILTTDAVICNIDKDK
jgi:chaperonin GroEL